MIIRETFGLNYDPFAPGSPAVLAEPVKAAFTQISSELTRGARAIVLSGPSGTGKTLLLGLIEHSYCGQGCEVGRVDVAAFFSAALDAEADLLLVDEADSTDPLVLGAWLSQHRETPRTSVLACRPEAAARLCEALGATAVHLTPLSPAQAKDFIVERVTKAGRADLFAPAALDLLIEAGGGSPQTLRSLAGMAMFWAAYSQAFYIDVSHVEEAVRSQGGLVRTEARSDDVAESGEIATVAADRQAAKVDAMPATKGPLASALLPDAVLADAEPAAEESVAPALLPDAVLMEAEPAGETPAASSSMLNAVVPLRPERQPQRRAFPSRLGLAAAAMLLAAIPISGSVWFGPDLFGTELFGTELFGPKDDRAAPVTLASVSPRPITRAPVRTSADGLSALDRVAKAVMPGRVVLAMVPLGALQEVSIAPAQTRSPARPQPQRRNVATLTAALATTPPPPSVTSIAGSQAMIASVRVPPPAAEHAAAAPNPPAASREPLREALAQDGDERAFGNAPAQAARPSALPPKYLTANAMALALVDMAEKAGIEDDDEFVGFRACVFRRVSPGSAEYRAFWSAVQLCIR